MRQITLKKRAIVFLLLFGFNYVLIAQVKIGQDIDGASDSDQLGMVTSISDDGTIVAIGAPYASGSGYACVYRNNNGTWEQVGSNMTATQGYYCGSSVSINSDGTIIAVGNDGGYVGGFYSGQVRVYENNSGTWQQVGAVITGEANEDHSGFSVSISDDGSVVAIGATQNDGNGSSAGHVRVYENNAGTWQQIGSDIDGEAAGDQTGYKVSLSGDGTIVAVSDWHNDDNGADAGQVRVFENNSGTWQQIGSDILGEYAGDYFGTALELSNDGSIVAVGAYGNDGGGNYSGHTRVFRNNAGTWEQIGQDIDGQASNDYSAWNGVSISNDGSKVAIGARYNDANGSNSGNVRVFYNDSDSWVQLGDDIDGEAEGDMSGMAVSLNGNGLTVAIGAYGNDGNGSGSGHVRVYALPEEYVWTGNSSTDWNTAGNWTNNAVPTSSDNVTIPNATSITVSELPSSPAICDNLTIESGGSLTINSGSALTVNGNLSNSGNLTITSPSGNGVSGSLITTGSVSGSNMTMQRWAGLGTWEANDYVWHCMGIPVTTTTASSFYTDTYVYAYSEADNTWSNVVGEPTGITRGVGYIVKPLNDRIINFTGTFNDGNVVVNLTNNGPDADHGYCFVANPYPSPIDLSLITSSNVGNTVWIWDLTSSTNNSNDYLACQISTNSGDFQRYILPCQGFFVKVADDQTSGSITFTDASRVHTTGTNTFKSGVIDNIPRLNLIVQGEGSMDKLYINDCNIENDGYKMTSMDPNTPQLYIGGLEHDYCIYNIHDMDESKTVHVSFKAAKNGTYTLEASEDSFKDYEVTLSDKKTGKTTKLARDVKVTFEHVATNDDNRFELMFKRVVVNNVDQVIENSVNIYTVDNSIAIECDARANVTVYSVAGKLVKELNDIEGHARIFLPQGIFIVKAVQDGNVIMEKVIIR
ncbi:hypothetical protein OAO55_03520 [Bacteroidales bacterium]|nr:hypothetical protein [Bacteroidales bacterium]